MRLKTTLFMAGCFGLFMYQSVVLAQGENFSYRLEGPAGELRTGEEFEVDVLLDAAAGGIRGYTIGVTHDPAALELLEVRPGSTTRSFNGGTGPDFISIDTNPPGGVGFTIGVAVSTDLTETLDAGNDYQLVDLGYQVLLDPASVDPCEPLTTSIEFSSTLHPARRTILTLDGESVVPDVQQGYDATVRCPGSLELTRCEAGVSDVELEWSFIGSPSWDFLFVYRGTELVASLEPDERSFTDSNVDPGEHQYTLVTFVVEIPLQPQLLLDGCTTVVNPVTLGSTDPAVGEWIGEDLVTIRGTAFNVPASLSFSLVDDFGTLLPLPIDSVMESEVMVTTPQSPRLGSFDLLVETEFGDVILEDAFEYGFIRGEIDNDKRIDFSDAIFLLEFLVLGKQSRPTCEDAADVSDDGLLDLTDVVYLLSNVLLGTVEISAPFPDPGADSTSDDPLGCLD